MGRSTEFDELELSLDAASSGAPVRISCQEALASISSRNTCRLRSTPTCSPFQQKYQVAMSHLGRMADVFASVPACPKRRIRSAAVLTPAPDCSGDSLLRFDVILMTAGAFDPLEVAPRSRPISVALNSLDSLSLSSQSPQTSKPTRPSRT